MSFQVSAVRKNFWKLKAKFPSKNSAGFFLTKLVVEMNNRAVVVMKFNQPPLKIFAQVAVAH